MGSMMGWLKRIIAVLLVIFVAIPFLFPVALVAAALYLVFDLVLHLVPRRSGLNNSGASDFLRQLWRWPVAMVEYAAFGSGDFPILPTQA